MVLSDSLKKRAIYIYAPSEKIAAEWKAKAEQSGCRISQFIVEHVSNSLSQEKEKDQEKSPKNNLEEFQQAREKNEELEKRCKLQDNYIAKLEKELKAYQTRQWTEENYRGVMKIDQKLIDEFKKRKEIRKETLFSIMKVEPMDKNAAKALNAMIETMVNLGVLDDLGGKWVWTQQ